jgi:acyl-[acyl-carrier-protein] desaturase
MAKEWMRHDYVPWSLGRDFDTEPWTPDQPRLTGVAQAAFKVKPVTQDNPAQLSPRAARHLRPWRGLDHLVTRWTAEEGWLAVVLRNYLLVTRNIDLVALEPGRMATMRQRWMSTPSRVYRNRVNPAQHRRPRWLAR